MTVIDRIDGSTVGLIGDTHCRSEDGADLPDWAVEALADADVIVHLGDLDTVGVLNRLEEVAPTVAVYGGTDVHIDDARICHDHRVIELGDVRIGVARQLNEVGVSDALRAAFGGRVDAVAFGATHEAFVIHADGTMFANPGSPTLPVGPATVMTLSVEDRRITARTLTSPDSP